MGIKQISMQAHNVPQALCDIAPQHTKCVCHGGPFGRLVALSCLIILEGILELMA